MRLAITRQWVQDSSFPYLDLTLGGWDSYDAERRRRFSGDYVFCAMKFQDAKLDAYLSDIIKPAVKGGIGHDLLDMRDLAQAGIIDNITRAKIRDSAFVQADLTHDNAGACWGAGYAEGLGKPVIYFCERKTFKEEKTHCDTNHCTTAIWSCDGIQGFRDRLVATLRQSLKLFPHLK